MWRRRRQNSVSAKPKLRLKNWGKREKLWLRDKRKGRENRENSLMFSKKRLYYLNVSMLDDAKTLGGEPYLYYSRKTLHYQLEISRNKEKSRDMDTLVHKPRRI
jgi:hypothetical protein